MNGFGVISIFMLYYENMTVQYTEKILFVKMKKKKKEKKNHWKNFEIFLIFAQNIDCGLLEPPCQGVSNEYPQSMFWSKNKKNR